MLVQGDISSSPYGSFQQGLSEISLSTSFPGQGKPIVQSIAITLDLEHAICDETATFEAILTNPLGSSISVSTLSGTALQNGIAYAAFNQQFPSTPIFAPAGGLSKPSIPITAVLSQGVGKSVGLLVGKLIDIVSCPVAFFGQGTALELVLMSSLIPGYPIGSQRGWLRGAQFELQAVRGALQYVTVPLALPHRLGLALTCSFSSCGLCSGGGYHSHLAAWTRQHFGSHCSAFFEHSDWSDY